MDVSSSIIVMPATTADHASISGIETMIVGDDRLADHLQETLVHEQCWLARIDIHPVGFVVSNQTFFGYGFVETLATHPDYRHQGVGTALMRHIESVCPTDRLFTSTNASNIRMQRLCLSLGYRVSGYVDNLDEGDPELIYVKHLR